MTVPTDSDTPAIAPGYAGLQMPMAPPPPPVKTRSVSAPWTGALLTLAAVAVAVGSALKWEKLVFFVGHRVAATLSITGLGSTSTTGDASVRHLVSSPGANGKVEIGLVVVMVVAAVLILAGKGRVWVRIVAALMAAVVLLIAVLNLSAVSDDQGKLNRFMHASVANGSGHALAQVGLDVVLGGGALALVAALLALVIRRRRAV